MNPWRWQFVDPRLGWALGLANNDYTDIGGWKHLLWRFWWRRF